MSLHTTTLAGLRQRRPEWGPWLEVVQETLDAADASEWDAVVPSGGQPSSTHPILAGATIALEAPPIRRHFRRLIRASTRSGTPAMATLASVPDGDSEVLRLFEASLGQDGAQAAAIATSCGADASAFQAVMGLLPVPFLQACNRRWSRSMYPGWVEGYCQVCGAWPAFAEARGIERNRFYRCGRCGAAWHARPLLCPYCGADDHDALVSLLPENSGLNAVIEGCRSCGGYIKTFTRLQGCPPAAVMLEDLGSVHLDVAALELGHTRPSGAGHALDATVTVKA